MPTPVSIHLWCPWGFSRCVTLSNYGSFYLTLQSNFKITWVLTFIHYQQPVLFTVLWVWILKIFIYFAQRGSLDEYDVGQPVQDFSTHFYFLYLLFCTWKADCTPHVWEVWFLIIAKLELLKRTMLKDWIMLKGAWWRGCAVLLWEMAQYAVYVELRRLD